MMRMSISQFFYLLAVGLQMMAFSTLSEVGKIRLDGLSTDHGLPRVNITTIFEDRLGFISVFTEDGLNLFDGDDLKIFTFDTDVVIADETVTVTEVSVISSPQLSEGMDIYSDKNKKVSQMAKELGEKGNKFALRKIEQFEELVQFFRPGLGV